MDGGLVRQPTVNCLPADASSQFATFVVAFTAQKYWPSGRLLTVQELAFGPEAEQAVVVLFVLFVVPIKTA
jgi:hypothetical protein